MLIYFHAVGKVPGAFFSFTSLTPYPRSPSFKLCFLVFQTLFRFFPFTPVSSHLAYTARVDSRVSTSLSTLLLGSSFYPTSELWRLSWRFWDTDGIKGKSGKHPYLSLWGRLRSTSYLCLSLLGRVRGKKEGGSDVGMNGLESGLTPSVNLRV